MSVYSKEYRIAFSDSTMHRTLRASSLLRMMTETAAEHCNQLGVGETFTLDRGLVWVIVENHVKISRMPLLGEKITVQSWTGKMEIVLYPRYYRILDASGMEIITASTQWSLMDSNTRHFAFPSRTGVFVPMETAAGRLPPPEPIRRISTTHKMEITVPYCFVDANGHLSNMHYLDIAEDVLPETAEGRALKEINIVYSCEIPAGKTFTLSWKCEGNRRFFSGDAERHLFCMNLDYEDDASEQ